MNRDLEHLTFRSKEDTARRIVNSNEQPNTIAFNLSVADANNVYQTRRDDEDVITVNWKINSKNSHKSTSSANPKHTMDVYQQQQPRTAGLVNSLQMTPSQFKQISSVPDTQQTIGSCKASTVNISNKDYVDEPLTQNAQRSQQSSSHTFKNESNIKCDYVSGKNDE